MATVMTADSLNTIEFVAAAEKKPHPAPPPALAEHFNVMVNRYYFKHRPNVEAFVDHGDRLRTRYDTPDVVQGMLTLAESRGWNTITVNGSHAFKQTVWLEGALRGLTVTGYQPTAQDQAALEERRQVHAPARPPAPEVAVLRPATPPAPMAERRPAVPETAVPEPAVPAAVQEARQQREARQAAIREQLLQQARAERDPQAAAQAAQAEKARQLREAFDRLDKRTALEQFPELTGLYPLVAEAERFAKDWLSDPQNRADFIAAIAEKGIQQLARGETLPQPALQAAPAPSQRQAATRTPHMARMLLLALLLAWRIAPPALASEQDDACGAILCLAGEMTGSSGGNECRGYIERYFRIVEKHHGDFSPSRTAAKRMDFLTQCPSGESDTRNQVNARYGTRLGL